MVAVGAFVARRRFVSARRSRSIFFWTIVALTAIGCLFVLDRVPPHSLRVDRWSAMTSFNERLLAGQYPYEARTHLGSRVSGLPMLFALGLPFQSAGDVGYLQVFLLVAFAAACQWQWGRRYDLVWPLLLLVASPAYLWEVAARSDLASNAMVAVLFLFLCEHWRGNKTSARMAGIGILGGLVASTRLVMLVPMAVYFVGYFGPQDRKTAAVAAAVSLATFTATLAPFVIWDARLFLANNPLAWQMALVPVTVRAAAVAASVVAGLSTESLGAKCGAAGLIVFAATLASFSISAAPAGVGQTPTGTPFDMLVLRSRPAVPRGAAPVRVSGSRGRCRIRLAARGWWPMRILVTLHNFIPEPCFGAERVAIRQMREMRRDGHDVAVLFAGRRDPPAARLEEEGLSGVRCFRVPFIAPRAQVLLSIVRPRAEAAFVRALEQFQPDVVLFHHLIRLSLRLPAIARRRGCPSVLVLHDHYLVCPSHSLAAFDQPVCAAGSPSRCARCLYETRFGRRVPPGLREAASALLAWRRRIVADVVSAVDGVIAPSRSVLAELEARGVSLRDAVVCPNGTDGGGVRAPLSPRAGAVTVRFPRGDRAEEGRGGSGRRVRRPPVTMGVDPRIRGRPRDGRVPKRPPRLLGHARAVRAGRDGVPARRRRRRRAVGLPREPAVGHHRVVRRGASGRGEPDRRDS